MANSRWRRSTCIIVHLLCVTYMNFLSKIKLTRFGFCSAFSTIRTETCRTYYRNKKQTKTPESKLFHSEIPSKEMFPTHQKDSQNDEVFNSTTKKIYLVSFPKYEKSIKNNNDQFTKRLWKWKDTVFGKGGIYFNSKMKSLKLFNQYLKNQPIGCDDLNNEIYIDSCVVLSNCARMDILLCFGHPNHDGCYVIDSQHVISFVAKCIAVQLVYFRKNKLRNLLAKLPRDMPGLICTEGVNRCFSTSSLEYLTNLTNFLESNLVIVEGNENIIRHFCLVSTGLAFRPRYTKDNNNPPVFRPFSSWDAHVMKQIKKSAEISECAGCSSAHTKLVIDFALQAGKAARNSKIVPRLQKLQNQPNLDPTKDDLMNKIVKDVHEIVIEPTVSLYMSRMIALNASDSISTLYESTQRILSKINIKLNSEDGKAARKILHNPVMRLRQGNTVDINEVLAEIENKFSSPK